MNRRCSAPRRFAPTATALFVIALFALGGVASPARGAPSRATGMLALRAELRLASRLGECPPGVLASACAERTGDGLVPGLGRVTYRYTFLAELGSPWCGPGDGIAKAYVVRLTVAAKGELELAVAEGSGCVVEDDVRTQTRGSRSQAGRASTREHPGAEPSTVRSACPRAPEAVRAEKRGRARWSYLRCVQRDAADGEWRRVQDHPRRAGDESVSGRDTP